MKKQIEEMTVKELKKFIAKETKKANTRLKNIAKRKKITKAVADEISYLRSKGIIGKRNKAIKGFRGKRKSELQAQARELTYFNQWKGSEVQAIARKEDYKKYQTFIQNNPEFADYSFNEWKELVTVFGQVQNKTEAFVYEDMKQLHLEGHNKGSRKDFVSAINRVKEQTKGQGLTTEDVTDLMRQELFK